MGLHFFSVWTLRYVNKKTKMADKKPTMPEITDAEKANMKKLVAQAYQTSDGNKSNSLSMREALKCMESLGCTDSRGEMKRSFMKNDTDGDFYLSLDELWVGVQKSPETMKELLSKVRP